jgi:hypothetical protein
MRSTPFWLIAIVTAALAGCSASHDFHDAASSEYSAPEARTGAAGQGPAGPGGQMQLASIPQRAVIRNAGLRLRVRELEKSEGEVVRIVQGVGGYVEGTSSTDLASERPVLTLTARVPVDTFDDVLKRIEQLGVRLSKTVTGEDVTEQLVDLDARLKIMRAQEETYTQLLQRAKDSAEMMQLHEQTMRLRTEIESLAARQKNLSQLAALSKIDITLEQSAQTAVPVGDPSWASEAWAASTSALMGAVRGIGTLLIWVVVFSPIWLPAILLMRRGLIWRPRQPQKAESPPWQP